MVSTGKVMNINFVKLIKFYIWSNGQLFIWKSLNHLILNFKRIHSHTLVFGILDGLDRKSHEYQYYSTHQDLYFIYRPFFHLTKCWESVVENPQFSHISKFQPLNFEFSTHKVTIILHKMSNTHYYKLYQTGIVVNFMT